MPKQRDERIAYSWNMACLSHCNRFLKFATLTQRGVLLHGPGTATRTLGLRNILAKQNVTTLNNAVAIGHNADAPQGLTSYSCSAHTMIDSSAFRRERLAQSVFSCWPAQAASIGPVLARAAAARCRSHATRCTALRLHDIAQIYQLHRSCSCEHRSLRI